MEKSLPNSIKNQKGNSKFGLLSIVVAGAIVLVSLGPLTNLIKSAPKNENVKSASTSTKTPTITEPEIVAVAPKLDTNVLSAVSNGNLNENGDLAVNGNLLVNGGTTLDLKLSLKSDANIGGKITVSKDAKFKEDVKAEKDLSVLGDLTVSDDIKVSGDISNKNEDTLKINDRLDVHGQRIYSSGGDLVLYDNIDLGKNSSSSISFIGGIDTNLLPLATNSYDLGSSANTFANAYINNIYGGTSGAFGYWNRTGTTLLPLTLSDNIATTGNIGVGTSTPRNSLDVSGSSAFGSLPSNSLPQANSAYFSGNIGIGTTNPLFKLQIAGDIGPSTNDTYDLGSNTLRYQDIYLGPNTLHMGTSTTDEYTIDYDTVANRLGFNVNGSGNPEVVFNSSGYMGIGTTSPNSELEIYSTDSTLSGVRFSSSTAGTTYSIGVGDGSPLNDAMVFMSGSTQYAFMNSSGNWGFGFAGTPGSRLSVSGGISVGSSYVSTAAPTDGAIFQGNVGVGTTNPQYSLDVKSSGANIARFIGSNSTGCTLSDGGVIACSSDINLKKNVEDTSYGLSDVLKLRPVEFNWNSEGEDSTKSLGFIAQEVETVIPKLISTDSGGYKQLNSVGLIPVLTKAIQEQELRIKTLESSESSESTPSISTNSTGILAEIVKVYEEFKEFIHALGMSTKDGKLILASDTNIIGDATLNNLTVTGDFKAGFVQLDSFENSLQTIGANQTLYIQKNLAGNIDLFNGMIIFDKDGSLKINEITSDKYNVAGASAGRTIIKKNDISAIVETEMLTEDSLIFVTPEKPVAIGSKKVENNKFEITLDKSLDEDLEVSWWIVN